MQNHERKGFLQEGGRFFQFCGEKVRVCLSSRSLARSLALSLFCLFCQSLVTILHRVWEVKDAHTINVETLEEEERVMKSLALRIHHLEASHKV